MPKITPYSLPFPSRKTVFGPERASPGISGLGGAKCRGRPKRAGGGILGALGAVPGDGSPGQAGVGEKMRATFTRSAALSTGEELFPHIKHGRQQLGLGYRRSCPVVRRRLRACALCLGLGSRIPRNPRRHLGVEFVEDDGMADPVGQVSPNIFNKDQGCA